MVKKLLAIISASLVEHVGCSINRSSGDATCSRIYCPWL